MRKTSTISPFGVGNGFRWILARVLFPRFIAVKGHSAKTAVTHSLWSGRVSFRGGRALFIAKSFGRRYRDGVTRGQQAGEKCAESEERGGCEQTVYGKGALHPVGEDDAEKAVQGKTDDNARCRAHQRDARGDPQDVRARRAERHADAELRSALRDAVSDDAEDADQRERKRHGREDAKQYGEEPLAAVLFVALEGFVEGEGPLKERWRSAGRKRRMRWRRGWSAGWRADRFGCGRKTESSAPSRLCTERR